MSLHIGIAAVSPEGAALFFQTLSRHLGKQLDPGTDPQTHPRITLHSKPIGLYLRALEREDWMTVSGLLRRSAEALHRAGADFCLTPDHAIQHGVQVAQSGSPLPWLSMPETVSEAMENAGVKRVGLVGTSWVTRGSVYQTLLGLRGIEVIVPPSEQAQQLDLIVFDELLYGRVEGRSRAVLQGVLDGLKASGCEGVVVASSEIPLLLSGLEAPLPIFDASEILADAAARRSVEGGRSGDGTGRSGEPASGFHSG
ncbi:MAG: aspartate/glutamate racemase family protein [Planctomycetota bacterium]